MGLSRQGTGGYACDLTDPDAARATIQQIERDHGPVDAYVHNPHALVRGAWATLTAADFELAWRASVMTAVNAAHALVPGFTERRRGAMLFTGATASVRGAPGFAAFASAKFALRGLAQSLARELGPLGVHVVHLIVDGLVEGPQTDARFGVEPDACIDPVALGELTVHMLQQPPRAWVHEVDVRRSAESW